MKKNWQIILFNFVLLLVFILCYGRLGDINVDSFREAYIPWQVTEGSVLYKNIFTIYAPFSYLFNGLLFLIFGVNLKVLYFAGFFTTAGILNLIFKISNMFMNKTYSLGIVLFIISASVLSPNVFNMIFPYSYGVLYGLLFILASIYFALDKKFPLAYFMYSFAVCSKYEFVLLLPLLMYTSGKKDIIKNLGAFTAPLLITYIPLFIQGVGFENLLTSFKIILSMSATKTLYWFYSVSGLVFRWELIPIYLINLLKATIPLLFMYYFRSSILILIALGYFYFILSPEILIYAFPIILILLAWKFKNLSDNKRFFVLASLLVSMKMFFALTLMSYGVFFIPFALISIFILIPPRFKKSLFIITTICALVLGVKNTQALANKNVKIQTQRGIVYTIPYYGNSINEFIDVVEKEVPKGAQILVYPENLVVNFLTAHKSDNKFYSLIPLYIETFGEDIIKGRFEITKPEYIVISNYNTSNYYYSYFGQDYAGEIFDYILEKYSPIKKIGKDFSLQVYKRKN